MTLEEALRYAQSSAGINFFIIGPAWSYLLAMIPRLKVWYEKQNAVRKRMVMAGFSLVVPLLAFGLKLALRYEVFTIDNLWVVLVAWASAFSGSQIAHAIGPSHPSRLGAAG